VSESLEDVFASPPLLVRIRSEPRSRAVAFAVAVGLGTALAAVHWIGLVAVGAAASLVGPTARRGVAYALAAGVLALVVFALSLGSAAGTLPGTQPVIYVTVASGLGLPLLGSLARGIY
jgi:flavin-dependent dehydrogenase